MANYIRTNKIQVICPICKTTDIIGIPPSKLNKKSNLTTISVHKNLICPHHFQFFIDNNFNIRGYQKVDLELNQVNSKKLRNSVKTYKEREKMDGKLFKEIILDSNNIKFQSLYGDKSIERCSSSQITSNKIKKMPKKEIYEEFWEFIERDNHLFLDFIVNDERRQNPTIDSNLSQYITV
ncbi:MAG: hypothetical protein ACFFEY_19245 [Candidatus Thorarchaeota archaeon]